MYSYSKARDTATKMKYRTNIDIPSNFDIFHPVIFLYLYSLKKELLLELLIFILEKKKKIGFKIYLI